MSSKDKGLANQHIISFEKTTQMLPRSPVAPHPCVPGMGEDINTCSGWTAEVDCQSSATTVRPPGYLHLSLCLWELTSNSFYVTPVELPLQKNYTSEWEVALPFSPFPADCLMIRCRPGSRQNCCSDKSCQRSKLSSPSQTDVTGYVFSPGSNVFSPGSTQICSLVRLKVWSLTI